MPPDTAWLVSSTHTQPWTDADSWVNVIRKQKQIGAMLLKARETVELTDPTHRQEGTLFPLRCSGRSVACQPFDVRHHPTSRTARCQVFVVFKRPGLWYFLIAALGGGYTM